MKTLNLHGNNLQILPRTTLGDLINLNELNMTKNGLNELTQDVFNEIPQLRILSTDEYKFCCIAKQGEFVNLQAVYTFQSTAPLALNIKSKFQLQLKFQSILVHRKLMNFLVVMI